MQGCSIRNRDMVFLKLQPYRQLSVFKCAHQKIASRFYGPYAVLEKNGAVAYKLQLPEGARIHPMFHVSLLKKCAGNNSVSSQDLPPVSDGGLVILEPQSILDTRWIKQGNTFKEECLVQWKRMPVKDATWEAAQTLHDQFPEVDLGDKCPLGEGSIVKRPRSTRIIKPNPKYLV